MYKLTFDRCHLPIYEGFYRESTVCKISVFFYKFLASFSKPTDCSAIGEQDIPVNILVSVRTDRTNELIVPDDGKFYTDCTCDYPNQHPLDDVVLLAAKRMFHKCFDCKDDDLTKVVTRTVPFPVGACIRNGKAYVYVTLVVDHKLKSEEYFKLKGCHYEKISDLIVTDDLEAELVGSLVPVNMQNEEVESNA